METHNTQCREAHSPAGEVQARVAMLAAMLRWSVRYTEYRMRWFFGPFRDLIRGARILDVGCGHGAVSFYSACYGAREVVGVEPEAAGSTSGVMRRFSEVREAGRFAQCSIVALDVVRFTDPSGFDAVVLQDSVNHIREVEADAARDS